MALKKRRYPGQGVTFITMVECPCGHEFDEGEVRSKHFLEEHTPDDIPGLSNRGDRA